MVKQLVNLDLQNSAKIVNSPAPVSPGDLVRKQDLDSAIAALEGITIQVPTDLDASTNPDYPPSEPGQSYYITVSGTVGGIAVNQGDQIICKNASGSPGGTDAAVGNDFFTLETNRDQATESVLGLIKLASQTEVNNAVGSGAVTPVTLNSRLNTAFNNRKYNITIGDSSNNSFVINHSLGDSNPIVQIRQANSPFSQVIADVSYLDSNNIQVDFINPPATNSLIVIVKS